MAVSYTHLVEVFGAFFFEIGCETARVIAVYGHLALVAFVKPYSAAVVYVYSRKYVHDIPSSPASSSSSQKAFNMERPTLPLFSGWNWQP